MAHGKVTEAVRKIEAEILNDLDYWGQEDKEAEKTLAYIAGVRDMSNAVIKNIVAFGNTQEEANV